MIDQNETDITKPKKTRSPVVITPEQINEAAEIAAALAPLLRQRDALLHLASNPICGKPGFGYKAARRHMVKIRQLETQIAAIDHRVISFVSQKGSSKLHKKLKDVMLSEMINWEQSNPVKTIDQISQ